MLTTDYDRTELLPDRVRGLAADLIAAGIDPERSVIYRQSDLPEVAEMALLLGMLTPLGWLERVPTYKERLRDLAERDISNLGLLAYPVLQTVDITIVEGRYVPVGEDQVSHLEISREIVRRFNRLYGDVLLEPQALLSVDPADPGLGRPQDVEVARQRRSVSATNPTRSGRRCARSSPIRRRCAAATPAVRRSARSSPCSAGSHPSEADRIEVDCRSGALGCVDCKTILADHLIEELGPFRERRAELAADPGYLDQVLAAGAERVRPVARRTLDAVRTAMHFA